MIGKGWWLVNWLDLTVCVYLRWVFSNIEIDDTISLILSHLFISLLPFSVAYVSRSGGMSNELNNIISMNSDGVYEGVAIGGDRFPGSTFIDHILRYENNPEVGMIVVLGEVSRKYESDHFINFF